MSSSSSSSSSSSLSLSSLSSSPGVPGASGIVSANRNAHGLSEVSSRNIRWTPDTKGAKNARLRIEATLNFVPGNEGGGLALGASERCFQEPNIQVWLNQSGSNFSLYLSGLGLEGTSEKLPITTLAGDWRFSLIVYSNYHCTVTIVREDIKPVVMHVPIQYWPYKASLIFWSVHTPVKFSEVMIYDEPIFDYAGPEFDIAGKKQFVEPLSFCGPSLPASSSSSSSSHQRPTGVTFLCGSQTVSASSLLSVLSSSTSLLSDISSLVASYCAPVALSCLQPNKIFDRGVVGHMYPMTFETIKLKNWERDDDNDSTDNDADNNNTEPAPTAASVSTVAVAPSTSTSTSPAVDDDSVLSVQLTLPLPARGSPPLGDNFYGRSSSSSSSSTVPPFTLTRLCGLSLPDVTTFQTAERLDGYLRLLDLQQRKGRQWLQSLQEKEKREDEERKIKGAVTPKLPQFMVPIHAKIRKALLTIQWKDQGWGNWRGAVYLTLLRLRTADELAAYDHALSSSSPPSSASSSPSLASQPCSALHFQGQDGCFNAGCYDKKECEPNCSTCPKVRDRYYIELARTVWLDKASHDLLVCSASLDPRHRLMTLADPSLPLHGGQPLYYRVEYSAHGGQGHSLHIENCRLDLTFTHDDNTNAHDDNDVINVTTGANDNVDDEGGDELFD